MPSLNRTLYIGTFIHTPTLGELVILHNTIIGVDCDGKIAFIERDLPEHTISYPARIKAFVGTKYLWDPETITCIRAGLTSTITNSSTNPTPPTQSTNFFFPGFIDTHTHAPQYPNNGLLGSSTLLSWLHTYTFPLESSFSSLARARTVYTRIVARTLRNGTTFAAYHATIHVPATTLLASICLARGQRALVGRVCMDRLSPGDYRDESAESAVRDTETVIEYVRGIDPGGEIVRPAITPRFAVSCSRECLEVLGRLHDSTGVWAQTHIGESVEEVGVVRGLFPEARDYASVYDGTGLLTERTILAHAVHLTEGEVELIGRRGANISHCPVSNTCLTSGAAKVKGLLDKGIVVGLGTDMSGGYSPSILEAARQAMLVSRHVALVDGDAAKLSVEEVLYLATKGGAKVVGLEDKVGSFELGMDWDAQMICLGGVAEVPGDDDGKEVDTGPVDIFGWESWPDRVAKWLYSGDDRNVQAVWVKGRLVHSRKPNPLA